MFDWCSHACVSLDRLRARFPMSTSKIPIHALELTPLERTLSAMHVKYRDRHGYARQYDGIGWCSHQTAETCNAVGSKHCHSPPFPAHIYLPAPKTSLTSRSGMAFVFHACRTGLSG